MIAVVILLCAASAIVGRFVLTIDEARRTVTVRLPALIGLAVTLAVFGFALVILAVACFVGGSFYGLRQWWIPALLKVWFETLPSIARPLLSGSWE